ncbi:MAG: Mrp/NBP35 family ATP-binding protein [Myxococcus sp.]|nr:Mrp/NBP35 family ATP-binding protein [Myxococcus sp.]
MSDSDDARAKLLAKKGVSFGTSAQPNDRAAFAKNVIIVTSGKGGVGKSTLAVNVASAFAQRDWAVGLLDADVYGPSIPRMLQLEDARLEWTDADRIRCAENFGLKVMSVGMTTPTPDTPLVWRSSVATSAMIQLLEDVDWGPLDLLVIDMPPGTGDTQLTMAQELRVTAALVVTTPQLVSTDDVRRAIRMLRDVNVPIAGLVENMSPFTAPDTGVTYALFGEGGGRWLSEQYKLPLLAEVPFDLAVRLSGDVGTPVMVSGTPSQKAPYERIVDGLISSGRLRLPGAEAAAPSR